MILEQVVVGSMQTNCYILGEQVSGEAVIIDPGSEPEKIKSRLSRHQLKPKFVINTHGHIDHIEADDCFGVPVLIHSLDLDFLKNPSLNLSGMLGSGFALSREPQALQDKEEIKLGQLCLQVIHTPGHTPGGICLYLSQQKVLFSGDTLFAAGVGRTDFPGSSEEDLYKAICTRLFTLPDDLPIYPGHGPASTIGQEKKAIIC